MIKSIFGFLYSVGNISSGKSITYEELGDFMGIWWKGILFISIITSIVLYAVLNSSFPVLYMIGIVVGVWSLLIIAFWLSAQSYYVAQKRYFNSRIPSTEKKGFTSFANVHTASRNEKHPRHRDALNVKKFIQMHAYDNNKSTGHHSGGGGSFTGSLVGAALGQMMKKRN